MKDLAKDTYSPIKNKPQECLECNSIINAFTQNTFAIWGASGHKQKRQKWVVLGSNCDI